MVITFIHVIIIFTQIPSVLLHFQKSIMFTIGKTVGLVKWMNSALVILIHLATVTTGSDNHFHTCRPSVRPYVHPSVRHVKMIINYWRLWVMPSGSMLTCVFIIRRILHNSTQKEKTPASNFWSQVSPASVKLVLKYYEIDFQMFGYSAKTYFDKLNFPLLANLSINHV